MSREVEKELLGVRQKDVNIIKMHCFLLVIKELIKPDHQACMAIALTAEPSG